MRRVLLVDDREPWRRLVRSILAATGKWEVVAEADDGIEAIQQAAAVAPDLILLDVELPTLNGIAAARHILAHNPSARILFVSAHRDLDIAEAAIATGARGYLLKTDAGHELLAAMDAILLERRFLSAAIGGRHIAGPAAHVAAPHPCHTAGFYPDDTTLLSAYADFTATALEAGNAAIVATSDARHSELRHRLRMRVDVDRAVEDGRFIPVNISYVLDAVTRDGWPDQTRFWSGATSLLMRAARSSGRPTRVMACGDCAAGLVNAGHFDAAVQLERQWDNLTATCNVEIFCGYVAREGEDHEHDSILDRIRAEHSAVRSV